jgi:hypothetical protein
MSSKCRLNLEWLALLVPRLSPVPVPLLLLPPLPVPVTEVLGACS